jgi:hypothetical protein
MRSDFNQTFIGMIMSQVEQKHDDSKADAWMAVATISIVVATVVFWLSNQG